ncbi:MAG: hypothetical protein IPP35_04065 [Elusimicrobia bacterium]|nr:hypothetical protein [Elusimicrobiota bacterium]
MKTKILMIIVLSVFLNLIVLAGLKKGSVDDSIRLFDVVGFSGVTENPSSTATWRLSFSLGDVGSQTVLTNSKGYVLVTGLWGGRNLEAMGNGFTFPVDDRLWEINLQTVNGPQQSTRLLKPAVLTLPFNDENPRDGIVDGTEGGRPVRVDTLAIWWLDEVHGNWVRLPDPSIDKVENTVTTPIHHFSVFAVMGGPSFNAGDIHAFPVPWRPSGGTAGSGAGQSGTLAGGITFNNLPSLCTIHIYTLSGSRVKEIDHTSGTPQEVWDVRSDAGEDLATGTYLWVVDANGTKKSGKLAVIR